MWGFILKNLGIFLTLLCLILFIMLYADLQIDRILLQEELELCRHDIQKSRRINEAYRKYMVSLVRRGILVKEEIRMNIPAVESEMIINGVNAAEIFE